MTYGAKIHICRTDWRALWRLVILVAVGFGHSATAETISLRYGQAFSANESVYSLPILVAQREQLFAREGLNVRDALIPGGGAKMRAINPHWLAAKILHACEKRRAELVVPKRARLLFAISQMSPRLGDWLLRRMTSG